MTSEGIFRHRHLPHWDVEDKPVFITGCLVGSIPAIGLSRLQAYRDELDARPQPVDLDADEWEHRKQKLTFAFLDQLLDQQCPVRHLADPPQAEIVQNAFLHFTDERYTLLAFVIMPSHHHWLFLPKEEWSRQAIQSNPARTPRQIISHSIQSYTATMCNRVRGESGTYWLSETFDHWARNEAEMLRIVAYIENNPVKAGLVARPSDWKYSSARIRAATGTPPGEPIRRIGF